MNPAHKLLREDSVEPLELSPSPRVVGPPIDQAGAVILAELAKLLGDEAAPVVYIDRSGLAAALEGPPEVVGGLSGPFPPIATSHHQEAGAVIQNRVDVDLPLRPGDAEGVDVHLPERVDEMPLEPLERLGFLDDTDHEPVPFQDTVNGSPARLDSSTGEDGVDPQRSPSGVASSQLEDTIDQMAVNPVRAPVGTARGMSKPLHSFLSVVSAPTAESALGDPEDPTDVDGANSSLQVLFDDLQTEANIFSDQADPFPGPVICPVNSGGQMSCHTTSSEPPGRNRLFRFDRVRQNRSNVRTFPLRFTTPRSVGVEIVP